MTPIVVCGISIAIGTGPFVSQKSHIFIRPPKVYSRIIPKEFPWVRRRTWKWRKSVAVLQILLLESFNSVIINIYEEWVDLQALFSKALSCLIARLICDRRRTNWFVTISTTDNFIICHQHQSHGGHLVQMFNGMTIVCWIFLINRKWDVLFIQCMIFQNLTN